MHVLLHRSPLPPQLGLRSLLRRRHRRKLPPQRRHLLTAAAARDPTAYSRRAHGRCNARSKRLARFDSLQVCRQVCREPRRQRSTPHPPAVFRRLQLSHHRRRETGWQVISKRPLTRVASTPCGCNRCTGRRRRWAAQGRLFRRCLELGFCVGKPSLHRLGDWCWTGSIDGEWMKWQGRRGRGGRRKEGGQGAGGREGEDRQQSSRAAEEGRAAGSRGGLP